MSEHMKMHHTSDGLVVTVHGARPKRFTVPRKRLREVLAFLKTIQSSKSDTIPAEEIKIFKDLDKKYGKIGVMIRGGRVKEGLTQKDLARKLGLQQANVSELERGKRAIGKALAHKLAKIFNIDYRLFL